MILNHIRGYVVDNGLPSQRIIEAVKSSIAREYNIKYTDLLSTKELCEELVKDIIGNIYISNENKKTYIKMLENYLEQNKNINDSNDISDNKKNEEKSYDYISTFFSFIASLVTVIGISLPEYITKISDSILIILASVIALIGLFITIKYINYIKKRK